MEIWILKNERALGGLYGIATAVAFWFGLKPLGVVFALCALVLVASAERLKN